MREISKEAREAQACENTDRELWREREGDYYADSIHVTKSGGIGIDCGGMVHVKPVREWHRLAMAEMFRGDALPTRELPADKGLEAALREWKARADFRAETLAYVESYLVKILEHVMGFGDRPPALFRVDELIRELLSSAFNPQRAPLTPSPSTKPQAPVSSANAQTTSAQTGSEPNHEANAGGETEPERMSREYRGIIERLNLDYIQQLQDKDNRILELEKALASLPSPTTEQKETDSANAGALIPDEEIKHGD